jgi:hypothetical protein
VAHLLDEPAPREENDDLHGLLDRRAERRAAPLTAKYDSAEVETTCLHFCRIIQVDVIEALGYL